MLKKIIATINFSVKKNLKKSSYWSGILWPLSVLVLISTFTIAPGQLSRSMILQNYPQILSYILGGTLLVIALFFPAITVREMFNDRSTKINELLWSMSTRETQFYGKMGAMFVLIAVMVGLYVLVLCIIVATVPWIKVVATILMGRLSLGQVGLVVILLVETICWLELLAAHVAVWIKNKTHINQSVLPVQLCTVLAVYFGLFSKQPYPDMLVIAYRGGQYCLNLIR